MKLVDLLDLRWDSLSEYLHELDKNQLESISYILWEVLRRHHEIIESLPLSVDLLEDGQGMMLGDVDRGLEEGKSHCLGNCLCGNVVAPLGAFILGKPMCGACHARIPRGEDRCVDKERFNTEWRNTVWGQAWEEHALCHCEESVPGEHPYTKVCLTCSGWIEGKGGE